LSNGGSFVFASTNSVCPSSVVKYVPEPTVVSLRDCHQMAIPAPTIATTASTATIDGLPFNSSRMPTCFRLMLADASRNI
jgi:hypothetical protein